MREVKSMIVSWLDSPARLEYDYEYYDVVASYRWQ